MSDLARLSVFGGADKSGAEALSKEHPMGEQQSAVLVGTSAGKVALLLAALQIGGAALAQCTLAWQEGSLRGVIEGPSSGSAEFTNVDVRPWDPDGAGPRSSIFVCYGGFEYAGNVRTSGIVSVDEAGVVTSLRPAGFGTVSAIATMRNGKLAAAFSTDQVAVYDGTSWTTIATNVRPTSILEAADGSIYIAGPGFPQNFDPANPARSFVNRYNQQAWTTVGTFNPVAGRPARTVLNLAQLSGGEIVVTGLSSDFSIAARYNGGTAWTSLATSAVSSSQAATFGRAASNGDLLVTGDFSSVNGVPMGSRGLARWSPATGWSSEGFGSVSGVNWFDVLPSGSLLIDGAFDTESASFTGLASWNGTTATRVGDDADALTNSNGRQFAALPSGAIATTAMGTLDGVQLFNRTGIWTGTEWLPLVGRGSLLSEPLQVERLPSGNLVAMSSPTVWANRQDLYLKSAGVWQPIAGGQGVRSFCVSPSGDIIATVWTATQREVRRWNGSAWTVLGTVGGEGAFDVYCRGNGNVLVFGDVPSVNGVSVANIASWNGTTWSAFGNASNPADIETVVEHEGAVVVGGGFTQAGSLTARRVARWTGIAWQNLGWGFSDGFVSKLHIGPAGELIALGQFMNSGPTVLRSAARWTGTAWASLGSLPALANSSSSVRAANLANGDMLLTINTFGVANVLRRTAAGVLAVEPTTQPFWSFNAILPLPSGGYSIATNLFAPDGTLAPYFASLDCNTDNPCDSIDFNGDALFPDDQDLVDFLAVLAGGTCSTGTCNEIDFNNDGLFPDDTDLVAFLRVLAGGNC